MRIVYLICGLLSSLLEEINNPIWQILAISSPSSDSTRQACYHLKIFNRDKNVISFDTNKATIRKTFHNAQDETIIINESSIASNEKRRTEILQYILTLDSDSETKPHNTAIISSIAQYLIGNTVYIATKQTKYEKAFSRKLSAYSNVQFYVHMAH